MGNDITLLLQDNYSNVDSAQVEVIKDQKALMAFFAMVNKTRKPGLPIPEIDFSKELLILICTGQKQNRIGVELSILKETEESLLIEVVEKITSNSTKTAFISPFYLYRIPYTEKELVIKS